MSHRIEKVNSLLKQRVSEAFSRELNLKPGVLLTISKIDTSRDLRHANVLVSVFPEKEAPYAIATLEKERFIIQQSVHKDLHMKILPKINFKLDTTEATADKIERILKKIQ